MQTEPHFQQTLKKVFCPTKMCIGIFGIFLVSPATAWASVPQLSSKEQMLAAALIVPFMVLITFLSGAYPLIDKNPGQARWKTGAIWAAHIIAWFFALIFLLSVSAWMGFLFFGVFALIRAWKLIELGKKASSGSGDSPKFTEKSLKLKNAGFLLIFTTSCLIGTGAYFQPADYNPPFTKHPNAHAKSNLYNLYLGCKAFWAEQGSGQDCQVDTVTAVEYGYVKTEGVNIESHGTETTFTATAKHQDSEQIFTMDTNGNITGKQ